MDLVALWRSHADRVMGSYPKAGDMYRERVAGVVGPGDRLLHFGCGRDLSGVTEDLSGVEVIGVDVDEASGPRFHGPYFQTDGGALPFADDSFDAVASEYVFEHIVDPDQVLSELSRVLRPGGRLLGLTPSRYSYKSIAAALTPHRFHVAATHALRPGSRESGDVFPTHYRLNSEGAFASKASVHGFDVIDMTFVSNGPTWFRRLPGVFELGALYHRAIEATEHLRQLRCAFVVELRRTGSSTTRASEAPLRVRCCRCDEDGMEATEDAFVCPGCGHDYRRTGNVVRVCAA